MGRLVGSLPIPGLVQRAGIAELVLMLVLMLVLVLVLLCLSSLVLNFLATVLLVKVAAGGAALATRCAAAVPQEMKPEREEMKR